MTARTKIAFVCYLAVVFGYLGLGLRYLTSSSFMSYHAAAVGQAWQELPAEMQLLLLAFLRGSGAGAVTAALALGVLILLPFRRGARWARWAVPGLGLLGSLLLLLPVLSLELRTGAATPWRWLLLAIVLLTVGAVSSLSERRPSSRDREPDR